MRDDVNVQVLVQPNHANTESKPINIPSRAGVPACLRTDETPVATPG